MSEVLRLRGLGAVVDVRCTGQAAAVLAVAMREAWSRCLVDGTVGGPAPADHVVAAPIGVRFDEDGDLTRQLMVTTQQITRAFIAAQIGRLLMFHAGALSDPVTGNGLVLVAPGGTGKTTLTRRLGGRLSYLTDETVGVDAAGAILPYPKPLSIRRTDSTGKDEVSPDHLGLGHTPSSARVSRVVLLDRQATPLASPFEVEELSFMDAVFALTPQTSSLRALERPLHRLGSLIDHVGPVLRVRYSEATQVENVLASMTGGAR